MPRTIEFRQSASNTALTPDMVTHLLPFIETRDSSEAGLTSTRSVRDLTPSTLSLVPTVQWQNRTLTRSVALIRHGRTLAHSSQASPDAAQETGWTGVEKYIGESDASEMKVLNDDIDALLIFVSGYCPTSSATNRIQRPVCSLLY